jgi:hypothetical protein
VEDAAAIELFLKDVAQLEPIKGREEYLPLTRRIERGRLLMSLAAKSFELTFPLCWEGNTGCGKLASQPTIVFAKKRQVARLVYIV